MSERGTPETDAALYCYGCGGDPHEDAVHADVSRRLERQRDELADALREAIAVLDESSSPYIDGCGEDLRWTERRNSMLDEHRALLARLGGEGGEG